MYSRNRLEDNLKMASDANSPGKGQGRGWVAVTVPAPSRVDPLALAGVRSGLSIYWEKPSEGTALAGFGVAAVEEATERESAFALLEKLSQEDILWGQGPRPEGPWFGGLAFDLSRQLTNGWTGFPLSRWILPESMVWTRNNESYITGFARAGSVTQEQLLSRVRALSIQLPSGRREPSQPKKELSVRADPSAWATLMEEALSAIGARSNVDLALPQAGLSQAALPRAGLSQGALPKAGLPQAGLPQAGLSKVVVARSIDVTAPSDFDTLEVLARLRAYAPSCTTFLFRGAEGAIFVGSTPETLCRLSNGVVETESLAGTAPPDEEVGWLERDKERREHSAVTDAIREGLRPLSQSVEVFEPRELILRNVKHLRTPMRATLLPGVGAAEVVRALHPTPAVGGTPRERAIAFLQEHEGMERGWYTGAVGWLGPSAAEFKVGVRSALLNGRKARVFVGAGVVAGSTVEGEWQETEAKGALMLNALGGGT